MGAGFGGKWFEGKHRKDNGDKCQSGVGQVKDTSQWPSSVCHKGVGANSTECSSFKK